MSEPSTERIVGADRVIAALTELAQHPLGVTLDELAGILRSPKPTVHRALATLRKAGLAEQVGRGVYVLGDEFVRLALRNLEARPEHVRMQPLLEELASTFGETAHYAILAGTDIVYRAKADPPRGAVRLTSVVGGRNPAYRTAVGKALLASRLLTLAEVTDWLQDAAPAATTPTTLVTPSALHADLERTRQRGYSLDDEENELGVNCIAFPVSLDGSALPTGAVSVSGVRFRCPLDRLVDAQDEIRAIITTHLGPHALA